jgi:hypothetical protein
MKYYIHKAGSQQGPYSIDELQKFEIDRITMVWHEGMEDWTQAQNIDELKGLFKSVPPPLSSPTPPPLKNKKELPPQNEQKEVVSTSDKKEIKPKKASSLFFKLLKVAVFIIICLVILRVGFEIMTPSPYQQKLQMESAVKTVIKNTEEEDQKKRYRKNLHRYLIPTPNNYSKDLVFGGISNLEIKLKNNTPYTMDQVAVKVSYVKANGVVYKTKRLMFNQVRANQQIVISAPNSSQGVEARCAVDGLTSYDLEISNL